MLKTLADQITAARFVLALALFGVLAWIEERPEAPRDATAWVALALFVLAALTDTVDGAVARRMGTSDFGRVADPFVDKILVVGALVFLTAIPLTRPAIPTWAVVVIVAREFLVTGVRGYVEAKGLAFPADPLGKTKMVLQCFTVGGGLLLLVPIADMAPGSFRSFLEHTPTITQVLLAITLVLTVVSGAGYFVRAWRFLARTAAARP